MTDNSAPTPIIADTIVAVPEQIRALADWLDGTLTNSQGIFQLADKLLAELHYDLLTERNGEGGSMVSTSGSLQPIGILPGWCADNNYWPNANYLKTALDKEMADLYTRLVDPTSKDTTKSVRALVGGLTSTLRAVAKDYDTNNSRIMVDLSNLDKDISGLKGGTS